MITGKEAPKRDPLAPLPAVSLAALHRGSSFLSPVIIITDARVHASAMERVDRRTARRRRWKRRSSRRVWSDVCPVCGGMRKTGSLYVLHARRLPKPSPSLRAAVAYACMRLRVCVPRRHECVRERVQSRASYYVRCYYTPPRYELFFPFRNTLPRERALITPRDARTRVSRRCKVAGGH